MTKKRRSLHKRGTTPYPSAFAVRFIQTNIGCIAVYQSHVCVCVPARSRLCAPLSKRVDSCYTPRRHRCERTHRATIRADSPLLFQRVWLRGIILRYRFVVYVRAPERKSTTDLLNPLETRFCSSRFLYLDRSGLVFPVLARARELPITGIYNIGVYSECIGADLLTTAPRPLVSFISGDRYVTKRNFEP